MVGSNIERVVVTKGKSGQDSANRAVNGAAAGPAAFGFPAPRAARQHLRPRRASAKQQDAESMPYLLDSVSQVVERRNHHVSGIEVAAAAGRK
ncbi:unnamed protein product [Ectocarpus sp. CCAP 1310/34]|nr:unnamed protein product [Ectocarpus sp. CCAP 1310/34]